MFQNPIRERMCRLLRAVKSIFSFMFGRLFLVGIILAGQVSLLIFFILLAGQGTFYAYLFFHFVSFFVVMFILSNADSPSYKITWIITIMLLPMIGGFFYLLFGNKRLPKRAVGYTDRAISQTRENMPLPDDLQAELRRDSPELAIQSRYIYNVSGYPIWEDCFSEYYTLGEDMFASMLAELAQAERYIFLEYFIIKPGNMWERLFGVLKEKADQGIEVRFMYDDLGSINKLPRGFDKTIRAAGIKLCVFNPFRPHLHPVMNHRDHRKLCLIDGTAAFSGGMNIADEYINHYERLGHWKDTGVLIKGSAVWAFAFMFLQLWEFASGEKSDYESYRPVKHPCLPSPAGYVQLFGDSPLDRVNVTQTAYHNILSRAREYVYITTPYLIIDHETYSTLCAAAQSGVDVRIITPYKYDRWYTHILTQGHYSQLIRAGVRIYEYTPGFMHSKTYVSDDSVCMVGTSNMDFRSFYLHFECSAVFYKSPTVIRVRDDFLACLDACHEITLEESLKVPVFRKVLRGFVRLFAPLL